MANNKGKKFEQVIRESFEKIDGVSIDRIPDQTMHHKGATNIADFIVYKKPYEYYIECKTVHGNTLPFSNIKPNQWDGLLEKSKISGVVAGVLCWWVDKDVTRFMDIGVLSVLRDVYHMKSVRYDYHPFNENSIISPSFDIFDIGGKKKRVFFDYDMNTFFEKYK